MDGVASARLWPSEGRRRFRSPFPAIHVFLAVVLLKTWMPGSRLRRGFDGLDARPPKL